MYCTCPKNMKTRLPWPLHQWTNKNWPAEQSAKSKSTFLKEFLTWRRFWIKFVPTWRPRGLRRPPYPWAKEDPTWPHCYNDYPQNWPDCIFEVDDYDIHCCCKNQHMRINLKSDAFNRYNSIAWAQVRCFSCFIGAVDWGFNDMN